MPAVLRTTLVQGQGTAKHLASAYQVLLKGSTGHVSLLTAKSTVQEDSITHESSPAIGSTHFEHFQSKPIQAVVVTSETATKFCSTMPQLDNPSGEGVRVLTLPSPAWDKEHVGQHAYEYHTERHEKPSNFQIKPPSAAQDINSESCNYHHQWNPSWIDHPASLRNPIH